MAYVKVKLYAVKWDHAAKKGRVNLWLENGSTDPKTPDVSITGIDAAETAAMAAIVKNERGDLYYDRQSHDLATGVDPS